MGGTEDIRFFNSNLNKTQLKWFGETISAKINLGQKNVQQKQILDREFFRKICFCQAQFHLSIAIAIETELALFSIPPTPTLESSDLAGNGQNIFSIIG